MRYFDYSRLLDALLEILGLLEVLGLLAVLALAFVVCGQRSKIKSYCT